MGSVKWEAAPTDEERLAVAKQEKLTQINRAFEAQVAELQAGYPPSEVLTWTKQEQEARNLSEPTPVLDTISAARGITREELASRVIAKADAYSAVIGGAMGSRQAKEDEINAASNIDVVNAIEWE